MLMPSGTGSQSSARELPISAKAPSRWRLMTRSPGLKRVTPSPTATISPAPSLPGMKGGSGRNWYFPASIRTSTYCTPRAWMRTCTSPAPGGAGSGNSRSASTSGPPNASQTTAFMRHALSVREQYGERRAGQDVLREAAEHPFAHAAVAVAARDQQIGATDDRRQQRLGRAVRTRPHARDCRVEAVPVEITRQTVDLVALVGAFLDRCDDDFGCAAQERHRERNG